MCGLSDSAAMIKALYNHSNSSTSNLLWVVFQDQRLLWRAQPASRSALSVSTSPRRRRKSPGSQRWSQRSHHQSLCSHGRFPRSQPHWKLCNLKVWTENMTLEARTEKNTENIWILVETSCGIGRNKVLITNCKARVRVHGLNYLHAL